MDTSDLANGGIINNAEHPFTLNPNMSDCMIPDSHPLAEAAKRAQIVHLKPDDVVVFSNVGDVDPKTFDISGLKEALGGRTLVFFPESVDIAILREIESEEGQTP